MNRGAPRGPSAPSARGAHRRRIRRAAVLLVMALAAVAWVTLARRSSLSADELFSLAMATGHSLEHPAAIADERAGDWVEPPTAMAAETYRRYLAHEHPPAGSGRVVRAIRLSDTSPPVYYLLLHYWTRVLGTGDAAVRLFSVVWAVSAIPLLIYLARRAGGPPAAVPAGVLAAVSPAAVLYSTEARMYSLVMFLASMLIAATLALPRRRWRGGMLALWILTGAAGLLTHYFFAFVWVACVIWLAIHRARWRTAAFWCAVLATAAIVAPWYMTIPDSLRQWRVTGSWLEGRLGRRDFILGPLKSLWGLLSGYGEWERAGSVRWLVTAVLVLVVVAFLFRVRRRVLASPRILLGLCVLAASFGPLVFDLLMGTQTTLVSRYALAGLPAALSLTAAALARMPRWWSAGLVSLLVVAALPAVGSLYGATSRHGHAFRQIAEELRQAGAPGDVVALVHSIPSGVLGVSRYADADVRIASWVGQLGQRRVPDSIEALTAGSSVVVFVRVHAVGAPAPEEEWLRSTAMVVSDVQRERARVVTFRPGNVSRFGDQ